MSHTHTTNLLLYKPKDTSVRDDTFADSLIGFNGNMDIIDALFPSGILSLAKGGTAKALTASNGGIVWSDADSFEILAGTATAGQILRSGASAAPSWSTATFASTYAVSTILYASSANVVAGLATGNSGVLVTSAGGVPSIATDIPTAVTIGTKYIYRADGTDVPVADGGTGLSTVASGSVLVANALNTVSALTWAGAGTKMLVNTSGVLSMETVTGTGSPVLATLPIISGFDIPEISVPANPAANNLRLFGVADQDFTVLEYISDLGIRQRICQDTYRICKNVQGSTINKGQAVYVFSGTGDKTNVKLARANLESTMPSIGVATANILDEAFGQIMIIGILSNLKTDYAGWDEGDMLYVDPTTPGALTVTRPVHPNLAQIVGIIEFKDNNLGRILVNIQSLTGIEDGTNRNTYTIGDQATGTKSLIFDGTADGTLSWNSATSAWTLTAGTITLPALTADWDIGDGRMIQADKIRARDGDGLALYDDGGNGIFVKDGGNVGIKVTDPLQPLHVKGNIELEHSTGTSADAVMGIYALGYDTLGVLRLSPAGANAAVGISVTGRGPGFYSGVVMSQFMVMNTDFVADTDNYAMGGFRAASDMVICGTGKSGTATSKPMMFAARYLEDGVTNANQIYLAVDGNVGINTSAPLAKVAINGGLAVGEDADPGDNNLKVVGNVEIDGALNHDGTTVGFYGIAPATQYAHIADATGAGDVVAQLNKVIAALELIGITTA